MDVPREQRDQDEHNRIERGSLSSVQHVTARPEAPVVVLELHEIDKSPSLRGRGDPVAV